MHSLDRLPPALLADASWYGTLAAARDLSAHGVAVTLACDSWLAPARWSRHVARTLSCPSAKDAADFLAWLVGFGAANPGHVLYPTSDEIAWLVAAHSDELSRSFRLYAPPIDSLLRILDKARLSEEARAAGLDAPEARVPRNEWEVERGGYELGFPLYVKPRAQMFGRGTGKGARVDEPAALLSAWQAQRRAAKYEAEVVDHVPDLCLPMLQGYSSSADRIFTVDGFIDETGEVYATLSCVKVLQRPRGSGPGIVFEHAENDPAVDEGLRRLLRATGFCGVFDAEFIEHGTRKLLIDVNPRFYNHMAFESDRGLHLPWLAYLAATGEREALRAEVAKARSAGVPRLAYIHRLPTSLMLSAQGLTGAMPQEEHLRWRRWIFDNRGAVTDPARATDDPAPAAAEIVMEAVAFARHPRAFLRGLLKAPNLSPSAKDILAERPAAAASRPAAPAPRPLQGVSPHAATALAASGAPAPGLPRLKSIDVFRGATIVAMVLVNAQFSQDESYRQLVHAAWNGWTFADTIFPCFLFIVGVSLTLSTASRLARGEDHTHLLAHAARRALLLFACGVAVDYVRVPAHDFLFFGLQPHLPLTGVLQKIAVCYLVAFSIVLWGGLRGVITAIVGFNLLYLGLLYLYPVPGCDAGSLTPGCNFPGYLDQIVLDGFRWNSTAQDPDGLGAILPAATSVLFGVLAGHLLLTDGNPWQRLVWLAGGGLVLIAAGELLSLWVPINKQLWTTSFAVLMAGLAATGLAVSIWVVDRGSQRRWFRPLEIFGSNAVAAYLVSRLVAHMPRVHVMGKSLYTDILVRATNHANASLLFALVVLTEVYVVLWFMDRRGWHLKL